MKPDPAPPRRKYRRTRLSLAALATALASYLGLAYLLLPSFWLLEDSANIGGIAMRTTTVDGIPGDPINVILVGSRTTVIAAFAAAGWDAADPVTLKTSLEIGESVVFHRPYPDAPVSPLLHDGRTQDLSFELPVGKSADQRHHIRLWRAARDDGERWLGAASFDRGVGLSRETGQVTHHIAADLDVERDFVTASLRKAGTVESEERTAGMGATQAGRNGGGDPFFTDGDAVVAVLKPAG